MFMCFSTSCFLKTPILNVHLHLDEPRTTPGMVIYLVIILLCPVSMNLFKLKQTNKQQQKNTFILQCFEVFTRKWLSPCGSSRNYMDSPRESIQIRQQTALCWSSDRLISTSATGDRHTSPGWARKHHSSSRTLCKLTLKALNLC